MNDELCISHGGNSWVKAEIYCISTCFTQRRKTHERERLLKNDLHVSSPTIHEIQQLIYFVNTRSHRVFLYPPNASSMPFSPPDPSAIHEETTIDPRPLTLLQEPPFPFSFFRLSSPHFRSTYIHAHDSSIPLLITRIPWRSLTAPSYTDIPE